MSTNFNSTGMGNPSSAENPNSLYNSISSQGVSAPTEEAQEPVEETNPSEVAIQRFGKVMDQFDNLTKMPEYSVASTEAEAVKRAMTDWLNAVVAATSKLRGESPTY